MKNNMLVIAYSLAAEAFKDTLDKQGRPYFEHCLQVMLNPSVTLAIQSFAKGNKVGHQKLEAFISGILEKNTPKGGLVLSLKGFDYV